LAARRAACRTSPRSTGTASAWTFAGERAVAYRRARDADGRRARASRDRGGCRGAGRCSFVPGEPAASAGPSRGDGAGGGGRRRPSPESPHGALRVAAFRGYADHMETPEFRDALDALLTEAAARSTAVMCAESVWWRCHRRLLADAAVLLRRVSVEHLFHDGRLEAHRPTPEARVDRRP